MSVQADYTFDNLRRLWLSQRGNPSQADNAAAVALAESGGNSDARDPTEGTYENGTFDTGLWQINGTQDITDPAANCRAAIQRSNNGMSWEPWCTAWTDGACGTKGGTPPPTAGSLAPGSPAAKVLAEYIQSTKGESTVAINTDIIDTLDSLAVRVSGQSSFEGWMQGVLGGVQYLVNLARKDAAPDESETAAKPAIESSSTLSADPAYHQPTPAESTPTPPPVQSWGSQ